MILHKKHLEENYKDDIEEIFNSITGTNFIFQFKLESELSDSYEKVSKLSTILVEYHTKVVLVPI